MRKAKGSPRTPITPYSTDTLRNIYQAMIAPLNKEFKNNEERIYKPIQNAYNSIASNTKGTEEMVYNSINKGLMKSQNSNVNILPNYTDFIRISKKMNKLEGELTQVDLMEVKQLSNALLQLEKYARNNNANLGQDIPMSKSFISYINTLQKEVKTKEISKDLSSSLSNLIGGIGEYFSFYGAIEAQKQIDQNLSKTIKGNINTNIAFTGDSKVLHLDTTDNRDLTITIKQNFKTAKPTLTTVVGISVKRKFAEVSKTNKSYTKVKLRQSTIKVLLSYLQNMEIYGKLLSSLPSSSNLDIGMGEDRLFRYMSIGIHEHKLSAAAVSKPVHKYSNFVAIMKNVREIFSIVLTNVAITQGDFKNYGTQLMILNNQMLLLTQYINDKTIPSVTGMGPKDLNTAAPLGQKEPKYPNVMHNKRGSAESYLLKYNALKIIAQQTIKPL